MAIQKCKIFLQPFIRQNIKAYTHSAKLFSPKFSHNFLTYNKQHPYHPRLTFQMAAKWADGPFPLIETPEFRLKVSRAILLTLYNLCIRQATITKW